MTTPLISANGLAAIRGERLLFKEVSLRAGSGETLLLRGSNGAGKTTLLRILAGLTRPAEGDVARSGSFHWIAHRTGLKPHETPREHLRLWARAWGVPAENLDTILAEAGLKRPADVPARLLSAGQRQRTALARLKLDPRPLWLMDEPFSALDVDARAALNRDMREHCAAGGAIIAAVHGDVGMTAGRELRL